MSDPLLRAWLWLLALGLASGLLAAVVGQGTEPYAPVIGAAILLVAFLKMRLILTRYLGLAEAPFWRRGFDLTVGLFMALLLGLYLVPAF